MGVVAIHPDDAELLREAATGDEDALAALVARHLTPLLAYARSVAVTEAQATDSVRDGMAAVLGAVRGGGEPPADVGRALLVAVRAAALERPPGPDAQEGRLEAALRELPANQRDVLALRELGLSYDEAGDVIGLSAVGAARLAWRGSGRLRSLVTGEPGGVVLGSRECDRALTLLTLAEDRPLPDDVGAAVRRHVAGCPHCRVSPVALADARALYRGAVVGDAGPGVRESVVAAAALAPVVPAPAVPTVVDVKHDPTADPDRHAARTRTGAAASAAGAQHGGRRRRRPLGVPVAGFVALLVASGAVAMTLSALDDGGEGPRAGAPQAALRIEPAPDVEPEAGDAPPRRSGRRPDGGPRRAARGRARERGAAPSPGTGSPARSRAPRQEVAGIVVRDPGPGDPGPRDPDRRKPDPPTPGAKPPAPEQPDPREPGPDPRPGPGPDPDPPAGGGDTPAPAPAVVARRGGRKTKGSPPGLGGDVPPGHGGTAPPGHAPGLPPGRRKTS